MRLRMVTFVRTERRDSRVILQLGMLARLRFHLMDNLLLQVMLKGVYFSGTGRVAKITEHYKYDFNHIQLGSR